LGSAAATLHRKIKEIHACDGEIPEPEKSEKPKINPE